MKSKTKIKTVKIKQIILTQISANGKSRMADLILKSKVTSIQFQ